MMLYKLTDENDRTYNDTQWGEGVTHETSGEGKLCGEGWIHAYIDPLLAVFLNPIHACFTNPHMWEAEFTSHIMFQVAAIRKNPPQNTHDQPPPQ